MNQGIKRISIEDIQVFRGKKNYNANLGVEYDFNKEGYKDERTNEKYYLVTMRSFVKLEKTNLIYRCIILFRCYTDADYSKEDTRNILKIFGKKIDTKYVKPKNGILRLAMMDTIHLMNKYNDNERSLNEE